MMHGQVQANTGTWPLAGLQQLADVATIFSTGIEQIAMSHGSGIHGHVAAGIHLRRGRHDGGARQQQAGKQSARCRHGMPV